VQANPAGYDELKRLGIARVPAVTVGDRAAHGWNPPAYAALLGIPYSAAVKLAPAELSKRLDIVLDTTQQLMRAVPERHLNWRPPERNRTLRNLGYHVFRLSLAFVDGMDMGEFPESWLLDQAPDDLPDGPAIARYGALVRGRISGWFEGASPAEFERVIKVYYGPQSGHDLLERTAWHAAQHLRQLYALAERLEIAPPVPMPVDAFQGLPLPDALW
jgi:DinB family protein